MCVVIPNIESVAEIGMAGQRSLPYCNPEINSVCVASAKLNKEHILRPSDPIPACWLA